jgi:hypothetical protein
VAGAVVGAMDTGVSVAGRDVSVARKAVAGGASTLGVVLQADNMIKTSEMSRRVIFLFIIAVFLSYPI